MSKMAKLRVLLLITLIITMVFPSISVWAAEEITLEFWTISLAGPFGDWIRGFIADYENAHPGVKIKWVDVPGADVAQKYLAAVSAGMAPDVGNIYGLAKLVELDVLVDVNEYLTPEERAAYDPGLMEALTFGGKTYGVPWYGGGPSPLVYSRKAFKEAGLDPDCPPQTFDEAIEMSRKIKDATGKFGLMTVIGQSNKKVDGGQELDWLMQEGVDLFTPDGKAAAFNTPEAVAVLTKWCDLYRDGYLPQEAPTAVWSEAQQWFVGGRGAFTLVGPQVLQRTTPEVLEALDADIAYPIVGKTGKALTNFQYLAISAQSKHPKEAIDFALYVTSPKLQLEFIKQVAIFPSRPEVLEDPYFDVEDPETLRDKSRMLQVSWPGGYVVSPTAIPPSTIWPELAEAFARETQKMYTGQITPEQALSNAEKAWNRLLSKK
ncbi:MAG: sugar ABC transporter substrate-binding protein [Firmicutes bacterium]|nr:sugar ABC transporter substrate-binding protein [Bacillota bacterium]